MISPYMIGWYQDKINIINRFVDYILKTELEDFLFLYAAGIGTNFKHPKPHQ